MFIKCNWCSRLTRRLPLVEPYKSVVLVRFDQMPSTSLDHNLSAITLSVSSSAKATGTVEAHLIPSLRPESYRSLYLHRLILFYISFSLFLLDSSVWYLHDHLISAGRCHFQKKSFSILFPIVFQKPGKVAAQFLSSESHPSVLQSITQDGSW